MTLFVGSRAAHSCDKVHNNLYIFGGWNGKNALNDLYVLDLDKLIWYDYWPISDFSISK